MTLYEKLFGRKPEVGHLRHFRCKAYKTLSAPHRSKFGTHTDTLFMIGYVHDSTTIWHFWDPRWRQAIQASNVTFIKAAKTTELELVIDTSACELGISDGGPGNKEGGHGLIVSNGPGLVPNRHCTSDGVDVSACELGISDRGPGNKEGGCGLITLNGCGLIPNGLSSSDGVNALMCDLGVLDGGPDNKEGRHGLIALNCRGLFPVDLEGNQVST